MKPAKSDNPTKYSGQDDLLFNYRILEAKRMASYLPPKSCYTVKEEAKIHQLAQAVNRPR